MNNNNYNAPQDPQYGQPQQPQQPQYGQPQQPMYGQPQQPMYGQPQQPQYGQPQFGQLPPSDGKGMSIAGLVCGIVGILSVLFGVFGGVIGIVTTILGIVFGVMGRKKSMLVHGRPSGLATAGLVLGIIGASIATLGLICSIACVSCYTDLLGDLMYDLY